MTNNGIRLRIFRDDYFSFESKFFIELELELDNLLSSAFLAFVLMLGSVSCDGKNIIL